VVGPEPELAPERILAVLRKHGVRFVLIGGFAAVIHGSPYVTVDVDVVPDRTEENLRRLSEALKAMHARIWTAGEPEGLPFDHDARSLAGSGVWNLVTDHGRLDITFEPTGTAGYEDVSRDAVRLTILGVEVDVASLADVIRSKEAAGREKDRLVLPVLRRILEETGQSRRP
jgi:predicted nucleotidyltransferase